MVSSYYYKGFVIDPSKGSKLSLEEKQDLVHEISKCSHGAPEMLQSWSRQDLLQILCAEMGKERKYTTLTKAKVIERLVKILSKKPRKKTDEPDLDSKCSPRKSGITSKKQRKDEIPTLLPVGLTTLKRKRRKSENPSRLPLVNMEHAMYCQNPACRVTVCQEDSFCKLCSCYICYQYDYNKDPSLWLFCSSGPPYQGDSCDMSCHLECALKDERALAKDGHKENLDVSCHCVSCGKVHNLLRCLRNQLLTAKHTGKVEVLCYRLSLSQKLLRGTKKYQNLLELVDEAVRKVEAEVGILSCLPLQLAKGYVSSLSNGPETQELCSSAVDSLNSILSCGHLVPVPNPKMQGSDGNNVENSVVVERGESPSTNSSSLSNHLDGDKSNGLSMFKDTMDCAKELEVVPFACCSEVGKYELRRSWRWSPENIEGENLSWKIEESRDGRVSEKKIITGDNRFTTAGSLEEEYENCVRLIRSLERKHNIEKNFREKFLSWYSLRASMEDRRIVKVIVDALKDKPISLSGQLMENFAEKVFNKRPDLC